MNLKADVLRIPYPIFQLSVCIIIGQALFGKESLLGLLLFAIVFAVGSYLLIDYTLRQKPDVHDDDDDIKNIGTYL